MARPWKPARHCSACLYLNDSGVNYYQTCGALTRPPCTAVPVPPVDETAIQERFDEFQSIFRSKSYERQKSPLEQQPFKFLGAPSPPRTVASCTAQDIVKFLISKDKSGRTVAHSLSCSKRDCSCPKRSLELYLFTFTINELQIQTTCKIAELIEQVVWRRVYCNIQYYSNDIKIYNNYEITVSGIRI